MEGSQFRIKNEKSKTKLSLNQRAMEKNEEEYSVQKIVLSIRKDHSKNLEHFMVCYT